MTKNVKENKVLIQFLVKEDEKQEIKEYCKDKGEIMSDFIRNCIWYFISRDSTPATYVREVTNNFIQKKVDVDLSQFEDEFRKIEERELNILNGIDSLRREITTSSIRTSKNLTETLTTALERLEKIERK